MMFLGLNFRSQHTLSLKYPILQHNLFFSQVLLFSSFIFTDAMALTEWGALVTFLDLLHILGRLCQDGEKPVASVRLLVQNGVER